MAKPKPPPYPTSLLAEDICVLIGFGTKVDATPPRYSHGANPGGWPSTGAAKIFNRKPTKRHYFELEPKSLSVAEIEKRSTMDLDFDRRVYSVHEQKQRIECIEEVHAADIPGYDVMQPIGRMVCSLHMFETFDGAPLLVLMDEKYDRVILAIGNMGERPIQWEPKAPRGYRPSWYRTMTVRDDLPVYVPEP